MPVSENTIRPRATKLYTESMTHGHIIVAILEDSIYSTDFFREKYETQAEKNLKISLARLS